MISKEQADKIKEQLLKQIESWPKEQSEPAKAQIESMNEQELEEFLVRNNLVKQQAEAGREVAGELAEQKGAKDTGCVFCSITKGDIDSFKLDENKKAVAVLEINPISKGHSIIIPKEHGLTHKVPVSAFTLANRVAKRLSTKLRPKPKNVEIHTSMVMGHTVINIIPVYEAENIASQRLKASKEELAALQEKLKPKPKKPKQPKQPEVVSVIEEKQLPVLKSRMP